MCHRSMFLRVIAAGSFLLCPVLSNAQAPPPVPSGALTLEQVLALVEPRSEGVQIAQVGIRRAESDEVRAKSGGLPQLSASASYDRALASEFEGVFDFSTPTCAPFALNPTAPIDARVAEIER